MKLAFLVVVLLTGSFLFGVAQAVPYKSTFTCLIDPAFPTCFAGQRLNCENIFGGTDIDFCADATGGSGQVKAGNPPWLFNNSAFIIFNETYLISWLQANISNSSAAGAGNDFQPPWLYNSTGLGFFNESHLIGWIQANTTNGTSGIDTQKEGAVPWLYNDTTYIYYNWSFLDLYLQANITNSTDTDTNTEKAGRAPWLGNNSDDIFFQESHLISWLQANISNATDTNTEKAGWPNWLYNDTVYIYYNWSFLELYLQANLTNVTDINTEKSGRSPWLGNSSNDIFYNESFLISWLGENMTNTTNTSEQIHDAMCATFNETIECDDARNTTGVNETWVNETIDARTLSITYLPKGFEVVTGTLTDGGIADMNVSKDGKSLNVTEASGASPLTIVINFTDVTDFNSLITRLWYIGGIGHGIAIGLYDYGAGDWEEEYGEITDMDGFAFLVIPVADASDHIGPLGNVSLRLRHIQNGIPSHEIFIDYASLVDGFTTITTSEHDALTGRDDKENHPWAMPTDATRNFTGTVNASANKTIDIGNDAYWFANIYANVLWDLGEKTNSKFLNFSLPQCAAQWVLRGSNFGCFQIVGTAWISGTEIQTDAVDRSKICNGGDCPFIEVTGTAASPVSTETVFNWQRSAMINISNMTFKDGTINLSGESGEIKMGGNLNVTDNNISVGQGLIWHNGTHLVLGG